MPAPSNHSSNREAHNSSSGRHPIQALEGLNVEHEPTESFPRVLLADDSPHAQRMGERILLEEGFEVVTLTDGETVLLRLPDVNPDVLIVDQDLPGRSGIDLCRYVRSRPEFAHTRVIVTAAVNETIRQAEAQEAGADAVVLKPFEASVLVDTVRRLVERAQQLRKEAPTTFGPGEGETEQLASQDEHADEGFAGPDTEASASPVLDPMPGPPVPETTRSGLGAAQNLIDEERVRAAVLLALESAVPALVDILTQRVLEAVSAELKIELRDLKSCQEQQGS